MFRSKLIKFGLAAIILAGLGAGCAALLSRQQADTGQTDQTQANNQSPANQSQANTAPQNSSVQAKSQGGVETKSYNYKGEEGKTALELLKAKFKVETKSYSGLGEFVTSINGVAADTAHFWSFYVNGKPATVGAGSYTTKDSETIEWKLEKINE